MRLSTFTDYSLRVLLYLSNAPQGRATIAEIACAFAISEHHLVKVAHFLGKAGYLVNTRGRRGGLRLAQPAPGINVGKLVRLTEAGDLPAECFDPASNTCLLAGGCGLQGALEEALGRFYETLERYSLADLRIAPRNRRQMLRLHQA